MKTRSSRSAKQLGAAALVSFSLIAAACGGSSSDGESSGGEDASVETDAPDDAEPDATDAPADEDDAPADTVADDQAIVEDDVDVVEEGPTAGGTFRFALEADVDGINPTSSALSVSGTTMGMAVFDTLAAFDDDGNAVPYLAESFTPNDDFTSWQVKLREGISFHDGTPLNAEAVVINFEGQKADPLVGIAVRPFFVEEGATEIIDDLTVQFNLADSNAYWPGTVTGQLGMVASPAWIAAALDDPTLNQAPVGTGPFAFESRAQDSSTKFVRNDDWWGGEVFLDGIEFRHVPDPDTRNTLLFNGEVDGLHTTDPASVGDLQDDADLQNILDENGEESFAMINSENPPFDDIRARQALTFATPRQNYLDLIGLGIVREANQGFVPESKYYNADVVQEGDDPEAALALVEAYCAEKGTETNPTLDLPTCTDGKINMELQWSGPSVVQSRIGDLLDEGWSNAGFNVTFDEKPQDEHILEAAIGLYNVVTWRQFGATDPALDNVWLMCRNIGGISLNWPRKCDESRDTLLLEAMATTDSATREGLYQELQQKIHDDYVYIFFNHTPWDTAVASNVHGMCDRTTPEGTDVQCVSNGRLWFSTIWMDA